MDNIKEDPSSTLSLTQLVELSAALATSVFVGGYVYAQAKALKLGLWHSVFGFDDFLRFGTQPLLLLISVLLLVLFFPFNLDNREQDQRKFIPTLFEWWREALIATTIVAVVYGLFAFFAFDPRFSENSRWISTLVPVGFGVFSIILVKVVSAVRKVWGGDLNLRNVVLWALTTLVLGAGILAWVEDYLPSRQLTEFTFSDGISVPPGSRFVVATSSHVVFRKVGGGLFLVPADQIRTVETPPRIH